MVTKKKEQATIEAQMVAEPHSTNSIDPLLDRLQHPKYGVFMKLFEMGQKLPAEQRKILDDYASNYTCNDNDLMRILEALTTFEKLYEVGLLPETMQLIESFLNLQKERYENCQRNKTLKMTKNARELHSKYNKESLELMKDLEKYLDEVEDEWHPILKKGEPKPIRSFKTNKTRAIERVFKKHQSEIKEIMKKHKIEDSFDTKFTNIFKNYTNIYIENTENHETKNGYQREKRPPRTEVVKDKIRKKQLENYKNKNKE